MVKPLVFKGEKKPKKRKRTDDAPKADPSAAPGADAEYTENDDSWVSADAPSDVSGPVMIVLPTTPPSALACDSNGKVFTVEIENIVDGNPASAEPHDVRQVWVANKIVGTEHFRLKGHHGRYLGCDRHGLLSATSEAVSSLESFVIVPAEGGGLGVQTLGGKFLSATPSSSAKPNAQPELRGDADEGAAGTVCRIRMQARFKPRIKASKAEKAKEKISWAELEASAGRRLDEGEVKRLRKARKEGDYHEQLLAIKTKSKHDKYS
ncbi:uncharacterized protein DNG_04856 [Cephalotrichum gorgonifer]|uniref:FRG1 domain-containing protein n=1 Tax=Cephalotrichum gorgonifer TaxID=2041049 RepID=A0AAE8MZC3_9PEZI|nr:uncharacterized protein DNG_04856 [Cephalotrichum gorgonifer]